MSVNPKIESMFGISMAFRTSQSRRRQASITVLWRSSDWSNLISYLTDPTHNQKDKHSLPV